MTNFPNQPDRFAKHICVPRQSDPDELLSLTAVMPEKIIPRENKHTVLIEHLF